MLPDVQVKKEVSVTNTGDNDAWVWYTIAYPKALDLTDSGKTILWTGFANENHDNPVYEGCNDGVDEWYIEYADAPYLRYFTENGVEMVEFTILYQKALAVGETTPVSLAAVYFDKAIDMDDEGNLIRVENGNVEKINWNINEDGAPIVYVNAYAIQADSFADVKTAYSAYVGQWGNTTAEYKDITVIDSAEDLVAALSGKNFTGDTTVMLVKDIDMKGATFNTCGVSYDDSLTIIGNGHTISNVALDVSTEHNGMTNEAMFYVETGASLTISDLTIENAVIDGCTDEFAIGAAVVVSYANEDSVVVLDNVDVKNSSVTNTYGNAAILVGYAAKSTVTMTDCDVINCTAQGEIKSDGTDNKTGAFFGTINDGCVVTLTNCTNATKLPAYGRTLGNAEYNADVTALTPVETAEDLKTALSTGENVLLTDDVETEAAKGGYSNAGLVQGNGGVIDGNGNEISTTGANGTWDCVVYTNGGTIKNATIAGGFRGIFTAGLKEDLIVDNVVIDNVCYTFSADESGDYNVVFTNSTLNGWTSYTSGFKSVSFTNCKFGAGTGGYKYAYMRPYTNTTLTNCQFEESYEFDATCATTTMVNCKVGDTLITAENVVELLGEDAATVIVK